MNNRLLIAHALKAAKPYLVKSNWTDDQSTEKSLFICCALDKARRHRKISDTAADAAEKVIMNRLGGYYTAAGWLSNKIGTDAVKAAGATALQEWRHRWLDSMIKEFSEG